MLFDSWTSVIEQCHAEGSGEGASPSASSARLRFWTQLSVKRVILSFGISLRNY